MVELGEEIHSPEPQQSGVERFERIVGQDDLKEALLAVAAEEQLDGLLIRGEKGTGKSTAVRGLVELLPKQSVIADCPYGCPPMDPEHQCADCRDRSDPPVRTRPVPLVTLPLGATRERVVGSLSVTEALSGEPEFEPGLLARAHRGLLYVDEVNLLDDHLVDVLLDAAASGYNRVERDGVSVTHPASFTLIGTMNPEEGAVRPQLRDRFALQTTVEGCAEVDDRVRIVDRALGTDSDRDIDETDEADASGPRDRLLDARDRLSAVSLPDSLTREIAELCLAAGVEGHRADIAIARASRAFAALEGRTTVHEPDIEAAARFGLPHRLQSQPFDDAPDVETVFEEFFDEDDPRGEPNDAGDDETADSGADGGRGESDSGSAETGGDDQNTDPQPEESGEQRTGEGGYTPENGDGETGESETPTAEQSAKRGENSQDPGAESPTPDANRRAPGNSETTQADPAGDGSTDEDDRATPLAPGATRHPVGEGVAPAIDVPTDLEDATDAGEGYSSTDSTATATGARVRTERSDSSNSIDAAATVRAAATREADTVDERDLRQSVRASTADALIVVAIDASASMGRAMSAAKGTVLDLLEDAYQERDAVAVVAFAGTDAEVLLPPTDSVSLAARHLKELPTGDRTPLPAGIDTTADLLERADPDIGVAVVVTDGRATAGTTRPTADTRASARRLGRLADRTIVVDAGDGGRGLTDLLAAAADGRVVPIQKLTPDRLDRAVGGVKFE